LNFEFFEFGVVSTKERLGRVTFNGLEFGQSTNSDLGKLQVPFLWDNLCRGYAVGSWQG
jgi:hypothetical protein